MKELDATASKLRRALANVRILADELARRDAAGTWTQHLSIRTDFDPSSTFEHRPGAYPRHHLGRAAVVCWDLGHNPAGRAMMLADLHLQTMQVDLVGPLWSRFSKTVWSPIEDGGYDTVTFHCDRLVDFVAKSYALAAYRHYDLVHICKARLPGLILGSMIARASNCPVIVDIDDDEQAFFPNADAFDAAAFDLDDLHEPTEAVGTALGCSLAASAGVRTVSNVELGREYGGVIVRHARSAKKFDPTTVDRSEGRALLGAKPDDFVILFVGTPRPHKGLDIVVEALRQLDERFVLHVVGVPNPAKFRDEIDTSDVRVVTHRPSDIEILPTLIAGGDAIALMQHLDDPISASQIPSKISDGLSMGCPVIISDAPPMRDLLDHGLLRADDAGGLAEHLRRLADEDSDFDRQIRRNAFLGEFSVEVNAARVRLARHEAIGVHEAGPDPMVSSVVDIARDAYVNERRQARPDLFAAPDPEPEDGVDIVVFWKQNDTGIYGRRSDMLTKYFGADPRVRRVLHIDKLLSTERAARDATLLAEAGDHSPLLSQTLLDRRLGIIEAGKVHHRTFLHTEREMFDPFSGEPLGAREDYADWVAAEMAALGMDPKRTIAWVCPVVDDFEIVHEALGFATVVSDVIDDQRTFNHTRIVAEQMDRAYRNTLGASSMTFTNCEPNLVAFQPYAPDITVVPNGAETTAYRPERAPLGSDRRPVVAYVGNMSDRVDWALLHELAELRPDHRFVMVGSAHYGADVFDLVERHDNVEMRGVIPYAQIPDFLSTVDVGLVPHLTGGMTERMNPLKVYNYIAAGLPVVSTPIPNIDELIGHVSVQTDASGFASAIDDAVERRRNGSIVRPEALLESIDWSTRTAAILDRMESAGLLS